MLPDEQEIRDADVIVAVNNKTGAEIIMYGKSLLMLIKHGYEDPEGIDVQLLRVPVDVSDASEEPVRLAMMCLVIKGGCDVMEGPGDSDGRAA